MLIISFYLFTILFIIQSNINSALKLHDELTNYLNGEGVRTAEQVNIIIL